MGDLDRKIEDRVLQLGSLNDAIRDANTLLESKYQEIKDVEEILKTLKIANGDLEKTIEKIQERIRMERMVIFQEFDGATAERKNELDHLAKDICTLEGQRDEITVKNEMLSRQKDSLEESTKDLEKKMSAFHELSEKLVTLKKSIVSATKEELRLSKSITELSREQQRIDSKIEREKAHHSEWIARTRAVAKSHLFSAEQSEKLWRAKDKDMRIVLARLKKLWPKEKSFPKITWQ